MTLEEYSKLYPEGGISTWPRPWVVQSCMVKLLRDPEWCEERHIYVTPEGEYVCEPEWHDDYAPNYPGDYAYMAIIQFGKYKKDKWVCDGSYKFCVSGIDDSVDEVYSYNLDKLKEAYELLKESTPLSRRMDVRPLVYSLVEEEPYVFHNGCCARADALDRPCKYHGYKYF